ncbi:lycopene cyclase family protein [Nocardia sp. NBC_01329]|uniref:lycopene cyclase family protein n=1 Tax=Nocardia sp. NBC_01329 TaxID=2903594 RepID=UPI002E1475B0|nr:lycopene cyclase family protein [Nocardia sp. NBC_01329]
MTLPCFDPSVSADIAICGLGPAGRALAHRCLVRGMTVLAVDPNPRRRWRATYAVWSDELPAWLDRSVIAATVTAPRAHGLREHIIARAYSVLDTALLQQTLDLTGATVVPGRVVSLDRHTVMLDSGRALRAGRVVDARGLRRRPRRAEQTAYGLMLSGDPMPDALFMDWRPDNGADPGTPPSFLYAVPLGGDTVLYEETCLVGAPALTPEELARRLYHRLRARGIALRGDEPIERVRFPVTGGRPGAGRFGAAGGYLHPATGYSVAAALSAADTVAAGGSGWTLAAHTVYRLRRAGLRALLALPPADIPRFFDAFFDLDTELQRAYLSRRDDPAGTLTAMSGLFFALPTGVRARLTAATLGLRPLSPRPSSSVIME